MYDSIECSCAAAIQILAIVISLLCLSLVGMFYADNRGALYSSAIFLYALTASNRLCVVM